MYDPLKNTCIHEVSQTKMVREKSNARFALISREIQGIGLNNNTKTCTNLKRSTEDVSPPNFIERNSGYYERSSRLVADTESYIRRSNHSNATTNSCQTINSGSTTSNINIHSGINLDTESYHARDDRCYRNGQYMLATAAYSPSVALSDRTANFGSTTNSCCNSRVPLASWSESIATCINGPSGTSATVKTMTASPLSAMTVTNSSSSSLSSTINSQNTTSASNSICSTTDTLQYSFSTQQPISQNATEHIHANASGEAGLRDGNGAHGGNFNGNISLNSSGISSISLSASHHASRAVVQSSIHGRSTASSSRSHSRSPSYTSSHSSSSSSSGSSNSHALSPIPNRDVDTPSTSTSRVGSRSIQSAITLPGGTTSSLMSHNSGQNVTCGGNNTPGTNSVASTGNPVVHSEDNRPLAIRVRNLPSRSSDTSLKDGLFHEYKKHGKVTWVKVVGQNSDRYALVCFKKPEDVEKALEVSQDKLFFGCKIEVEPYQGYDVEDNEFRPYEAELDEYHPKSTRTLFIGNLEKDITAGELRTYFECFGEIIEIDIKKQGTSAYAFCQYSDIVSVVKAMRKMDGEHLGNNRIKLGFGKSMPTNCVWIDGIAEKISESQLQSQFSRYGAVCKVVIDRLRQLALVLYEQIQYAQTAVKEMRGTTVRGRKLQVDFASRECQDAFYDKIEKQISANTRFSRYESQSRSRASSFSRHQNSNDGCSPSNTPGSSSSSSVGCGGGGNAPALSSAVVAGSTASTYSGGPLTSGVSQNSGNSTPARSRSSRSSRHTMEYDYIDSRRFRSYDEYSQGSGASHDEDAPNSGSHSILSGVYNVSNLRSDSPLLSRLGPIINNYKEPATELLEIGLTGRRRCDKSPGKQKGDMRLFQKERTDMLEQLEECPSSGEESAVSPRKRIKLDHHSISSISSGLLQPHKLEEQPSHKNSSCDYILHDAIHRKSELRRLSECSNLGVRFQQLSHHHHHTHHSLSHHHHHQQQQQQQLCRRPSIDILATSTGGGSSNVLGRHGSTSSTSSNSDHHPLTHQSLASKRRRICGSSSVADTSTLLIGPGISLTTTSANNEDFHHNTSRVRGHPVHSQHSHDPSGGGDSADGSRPGTPLCDERPEVLPSEPRRVPRDRPREPMILPLPRFGVQFFQQYRNNLASSIMSSTIASANYHFHSNNVIYTCASSVGNNMALGSTRSLSNVEAGGGSNNSHSSLSYSSAAITSTASSVVTRGSLPSSSLLPSSSARYSTHWRTHHHHHHHHHHNHHSTHGQPNSHAGVFSNGGATSSPGSSMISPLRSRSLSTNSSDSDMPGQSSTGSPSLEDRIRTLDEMLERLPGGGVSNSSSTLGKRPEYNSTAAADSRQHHRPPAFADHPHSGGSEGKLVPPSSAPSSRHKFFDISVKERQPSEIVKTVLAKKSIFDDDLQRLKRNHWYESAVDNLQSTSPTLPNLAATKTPLVGYLSTTISSSCVNTFTKPHSTVVQRLCNLSPMNSPQASTSPYNSPSQSPSASGNTFLTSSHIAKATGSNNTTTILTQLSTTSSIVSSATSSSGTKALQYPFPTHPPLPTGDLCVHSKENQPLAPQPMTKAPSLESASISNKPKNYALSKSLSVPTSTIEAPDSRIPSKSALGPESANVSTANMTTTTTTSSTSLPINNAHYDTIGISSSISTTTTTTDYNTMEIDKDAKSVTASNSLPEVLFIAPENSESMQTQHQQNSNEEKLYVKSDRNVVESRKSSLSKNFTCTIETNDEQDAIEREQLQNRNKAEKMKKERLCQREKDLQKQHEHEEKQQDMGEKEAFEKKNFGNEEKMCKQKNQQGCEESSQKGEKEERARTEAKPLKREKEQSAQGDDNRKRDANVLNDYSRKTIANNHQKPKSQETAPQEFYRRNTNGRQNNKENSEGDVPCGGGGSADNLNDGTSSDKSKCRKPTPDCHPKRRLSSQESNASNCATNILQYNDQIKRVCVEPPIGASTQSQTKTSSVVNNKMQDRGFPKDFITNKSRINKHQQQPAYPSNPKAASEIEHNSTSLKCHRNKHVQKDKLTTQTTIAQPSNNATLTSMHSSKNETKVAPPKCSTKTETEQISDEDVPNIALSSVLIQSSDDDDPLMIVKAPIAAKTPSSSRKHKEHCSGGGNGGHHNRHKNSKREREHHREKKRNSSAVNESVPPSVPPNAVSCTAMDKEATNANVINTRHSERRISTTSSDTNTKTKQGSQSRVVERKSSRCLDEVSSVASNLPNRQSQVKNSTPSVTRRMLISSAEDTDDGGLQATAVGDDDDDSDAITRKTSIFDIPTDGPYISMYDKVKARSCKNMQKQEEEKKIKAKFTQLKQSRAKREEKKRSTSYDGDSDSDFEGTETQNRIMSRSSTEYKSPVNGGSLSSTDDDSAPNQANRSGELHNSHLSISRNSVSTHLCLASDNDVEAQCRIKLQNNTRRLCDDGEDSSEEELIRRNYKASVSNNKRNTHYHTSRIASDSESQSHVDIQRKIKTLDASDGEARTQLFEQAQCEQIKEEANSTGSVVPIKNHDEIKLKRRLSLCSSGDEQTVTLNIEVENTMSTQITTKKEFANCFDENCDKYRTEEKYHKSATQADLHQCSPELGKVKKHKRNKKRQKTLACDNYNKEQTTTLGEIKAEKSSIVNMPNPLLSLHVDTKNVKLLASPPYDAFDELKQGVSLISQISPNAPQQTCSERKRHKDRKEKKREKIRHLSVDASSCVDLEKLYEKEKHRLKKSKKSKSIDGVHNNNSANVMRGQLEIISPDATFTRQYRKSGGEKMEDIFGPISDEEEEEDAESQNTDSDMGSADMRCLSNRSSSTFNITGPIVSAALNPYKQEPLTLMSHTIVPENEENKQKFCDVTSTPHLERILERRHRKEKREKKRRERGKSRAFEHRRCTGSAKILDDENSVDLDAAGRALEAQLMEDSDNKCLEEVTPSTATTHHSDMIDVFRFSECDDNSLELECSTQRQKEDVEKEHINLGGKLKEKKKKKKRSKEEKLSHHHQRRESSSSNASQQANKLNVDIHPPKKSDNHDIAKKPSLCKPSPSLPCLVSEDDNDLMPGQIPKSSSISNTGNRLCTSSSRNKSPHDTALTPLKDKQQLNSSVSENPSTGGSNSFNADINQNKLLSALDSSYNEDVCSSSNISREDESCSQKQPTPQKRKPEIFIPGFDGTIDDRISESAVQSISAEFNTLLLDSSVDEAKIPVESTPDVTKEMEKFEESKSRVIISQEETESAVSALLGESFGNSTTDYSFNDDGVALDGLNVLNVTDAEPEQNTLTIVAEGLDEEAALAAKSIENEVPSSAPVSHVEEDSEEITKAIQNLHQEEMDAKAETPQSVRDLQIDTDTEENIEEADSNVALSLKGDEANQLNNKTAASTKSSNCDNLRSIPLKQTPQTTVITKVDLSTNRPITSQYNFSNRSIHKDKHQKVSQSDVNPSTTQTEDSLQALSQKIKIDIQPVSLNLEKHPPPVVTKVSSTVTSACLKGTLTPPSQVSIGSIKGSLSCESLLIDSSANKKMEIISTKQTSSVQDIPHIMQPPKITIPNATHFAIPLAISPRGVISTYGDESAFSNSPRKNQVLSELPLTATHVTSAQAQSPPSPRSFSSRDNAAVLRQDNLHVKPSQQQAANIIQRSALQQHSDMSTAVSTAYTQNTNAVTIPPQQKQSPTIGDSQLMKGNNNPGKCITKCERSPQQQQGSQQHIKKVSTEQYIGLPVPGQHILPISVQKIPPVPANPTIISTVVSLTPQHETNSNVSTSSSSSKQPKCSKGTTYSTPLTSVSGGGKLKTTTTTQIVHHMVKAASTVSTQQHSNPAASQITQHKSIQQSHMPFMQQQQSQQQQQQQQRDHVQQRILQNNVTIHQQQSPTSLSQSQSQSQSRIGISQPPQQTHILVNSSQQQSTSSHGSTMQKQQQKVIQSPQGPQHYVVQQHIVGLPSPQNHVQQMQHLSRAISPPSQSIHTKSRQTPQAPVQQTPHQQDRQYHCLQPISKRLVNPTNLKDHKNTQNVADASRVIVSTNQTSEEFSVSPPKISPEVTKSSCTILENVSVIRTPTPTSVISPAPLQPESVVSAALPNAISKTILSTEKNTVKGNKNEEVLKADNNCCSVKKLNTESPNTTVIKKTDSVSSTSKGKKNSDEGENIQKLDTCARARKSADANTSESKSEIKGGGSSKDSEMKVSDSGDVVLVAAGEVKMQDDSFLVTRNVNTDNDTEDETETQKMPTFEQIEMCGKLNQRGSGTGVKRGRQMRGGKKAPLPITPTSTSHVEEIASPHTEINIIDGVQTRLRKPIPLSPVTRGRKGRPPRNILLQQHLLTIHQKQQDEAAAVSNNSTNSVLTAGEKKSRNQAAVTAATSTFVSISEEQDVYEFHDDSGEEGKTTTSPLSMQPNQISTTTADIRPRLILNIKSPSRITPIVKVSGKCETNEDDLIQEKLAPKPHVVPIVNEIAQKNLQVDPLSTEMSPMNTRKSRRLLEKDRSTIDDIIEDVVRNTATNLTAQTTSGLTNVTVSTNSLTKELLQIQPRRSGRNAVQPKVKPNAEVVVVPTNPMGRLRKLKESKMGSDSVEMGRTTLQEEESETEEPRLQQTPLQKQQQQQQPQRPAVSPLPSSSLPISVLSQHPKKKALAAAEIETYVTASTTTTTAMASSPILSTSSLSISTATHSALPIGGVPIPNTAAPASQKTTGGAAAEASTKCLIDPITGVLSGIQTQQGKEGSLPVSAAVAPMPIITHIRQAMDAKKTIMHGAVPSLTIDKEGSSQSTAEDAPNSKMSYNNNSMVQGPVATPITALMKSIQGETETAVAAATTASLGDANSSMLNKSISVVVKPPVAPPLPASVTIQQIHQGQGQLTQQKHVIHQQTNTQSSGTAIKHSVVIQPQNTITLHGQQTNTKTLPPNLKTTHVLGGQKSQQQQYQPQPALQQTQPQLQQQASTIHNQHSLYVSSGPPTTHTQPQANVAARHTLQSQQQQQPQPQPQIVLSPQPKQLLVNIPPPSIHSPRGGNSTSTSVCSPHLQTFPTNQPSQTPLQLSQSVPQCQQTVILKQSHENNPQVLHVISSKAPTFQGKQTPAKIQQHQNHQQQQTMNVTYSAPHQQQIHKPPTKSVPPVSVLPPALMQQKPSPDIMGLPTQPTTVVVQTKAMVAKQSPGVTGALQINSSAHLQQVQHHSAASSPPLQSQHVQKANSNPVIHNIPGQGVSHMLPMATSTSSMKQQPLLLAGGPNMRIPVPAISPQGQTRVGPLLLPSTVQVPAHFDASTQQDIGSYGSAGKVGICGTQSPPPAHQQTNTNTTGDSTYSGGALRGVPSREHFMIYQQLLRSSQQETLTSTATLREYEENMMGSPPLELRRPGSAPRTVGVPHSLQSPQDRATDSPQVAQVYVHSNRVPAHPPYNAGPTTAPPSGFYEASRQIAREPPPAHRSAAGHNPVVPPVIVPHPSSGSGSPFVATVPSAATIAQNVPPGSLQHPKLTERDHNLENDRDRDRDREQFLQREKEQVMIRSAEPHMQVNAPALSPTHSQISAHGQPSLPAPHDSLLTLLQRYPVMWQGLLALKTDQAAVQMHFVFGNPHVARASLPCNSDGSTPPLRIAQRMRLEQTQLDGVARKMQFENEHCMLLALPCGRDHADVLQQSRNLQYGFIQYLQQKTAAGIVNIPMPGSEQAAYVVHIFPSCLFANENLERAAPDLKHRVSEINHLLIVIATV